MPQPDRLRITQSLLSAWNYVYLSDDGYERFLEVLNRVPVTPNQAMLDGTHFEHLVNESLRGNAVADDDQLAIPVNQLTKYLQGTQQQVVLFKDVEVDGQRFLLHGIMDFLRCGICFDTKFSKSYHLDKYLDSPQHPMYFALAPNVYEFQYLICDGKYLYREIYRPENCQPIELKIKQFVAFLKRTGNWETYCRLWNPVGYENYERWFSV